MFASNNSIDSESDNSSHNLEYDRRGMFDCCSILLGLRQNEVPRQHLKESETINELAQLSDFEIGRRNNSTVDKLWRAERNQKNTNIRIPICHQPHYWPREEKRGFIPTAPLYPKIFGNADFEIEDARRFTYSDEQSKDTSKSRDILRIRSNNYDKESSVSEDRKGFVTDFESAENISGWSTNIDEIIGRDAFEIAVSLYECVIRKKLKKLK